MKRSRPAGLARSRAPRAWPRLVLAVALIASGATFAVAGPARAGGAAVAIIVGPSGSLTKAYRAMADAAARQARRWTDDVRTVYSPEATWSAARAALTGASIVVYLGHGNGWPSRYRDAPYPKTQNGLGLNAVAGGGDVAHQYFGESYLRREVRLAPGAVVLLHHLCYASGNSEPGLPEGTLDVARQRVDNFAAGWLAAGARAVVAEAYLGPAYYVRSLFAGRASVEAIWRRSPTYHDHVLEYASERTPGYAVQLDPIRRSSGFSRSLVVDHELTTDTVLAGAGAGSGGRSTPRATPPPAPSAPQLVAGRPSVDRSPVAGGPMTVRLPITAGLPAEARLGARWTPLEVRPAAVDAGAAPDASPPASDPPAGDASATPSAGSVPPLIESLAIEAPGDVVIDLETRRDGADLVADATVPERPGLYRVALSLHDEHGQAFDAATQTRLPSLIVRVADAFDVGFGAVAPDRVAAGQPFDIRVRVANSGTQPWQADRGPVTGHERPAARSATSRVSIAWLTLGTRGGSEPLGLPPTVVRPIDVDPGTDIVVELHLVAPREAGDYLLVLDIATDDGRSAVAHGASPGLLRISVTPVPPRSVAEPAAD